MASEMQDTRVSCVAPGCSRVSKVITRTGRQAQINMKAKQLVSYRFILGRLANTKLHLVGIRGTHKLKSRTRDYHCFVGRTVSVKWA